MLVLMAGLPGAGKSTLARAVAARIDGIVLDKDVIRAALFPAHLIEFSTSQDDFVMDVMLDTATNLLQRDPARVIFLDGRPFSRRYQLETAIARADSIPTPWRIVECTCPEEVARMRLEADAAHHPAANRNFELYLEVKRRFEEITRPKLVIHTTKPLESCVGKVLRYVSPRTT